MAFEIQRTQRSLPGRAGAVRANVDVDTGGQLVGQALQGLGGALANEGMRWLLIEADQQADEAINQIEQEHTRYLYELPKMIDTSVESYNKVFNESMAVRKAIQPKNRLAQRKVQAYITKNSARWDADTVDARHAKLKDLTREFGFVLQQDAIRSNEANVDENFAKYQMHLWKGKIKGIYTAEQVAKYMQTASDGYEKFSAAESARLQREQKEALAEAQKQAASQFLVRMWDGDLTDPQEVTDALANDLISDTDAKYIRNALLSKEPPELDLNTYAKALSLINDYRNAKVKREDVVSFITANFKKIDPATGKSLIAELISVEDPEDPLNTTPAKIYATLLKDLYDGDDITALEYDQLHTQLKSYIKKNPDATPKQRAEFFEDLMKDVTKSIWKKLFGKWKATPFGKPYRMITGEKAKLPFPESLEDFERTVSGIEDEAEAKKYYEKWKDRW